MHVDYLQTRGCLVRTDPLAVTIKHDLLSLGRWATTDSQLVRVVAFQWRVLWTFKHHFASLDLFLILTHDQLKRLVVPQSLLQLGFESCYLLIFRKVDHILSSLLPQLTDFEFEVLLHLADSAYQLDLIFNLALPLPLLYRVFLLLRLRLPLYLPQLLPDGFDLQLVLDFVRPLL